MEVYVVDWTWRNQQGAEISHACRCYTDVKTMDEAYDRWREEYWRTMFDPFKVKLLDVTVRKEG